MEAVNAQHTGIFGRQHRAPRRNCNRRIAELNSPQTPSVIVSQVGQIVAPAMEHQFRCRTIQPDDKHFFFFWKKTAPLMFTLCFNFYFAIIFVTNEHKSSQIILFFPFRHALVNRQCFGFSESQSYSRSMTVRARLPISALFLDVAAAKSLFGHDAGYRQLKFPNPALQRSSAPDGRGQHRPSLRHRVEHLQFCRCPRARRGWKRVVHMRTHIVHITNSCNARIFRSNLPRSSSDGSLPINARWRRLFRDQRQMSARKNPPHHDCKARPFRPPKPSV